MAIRTALLNWNNISRDTDFSKYIETVSEPWVIEWLTVTATKVAIWKARVPCLRTNGETIFSLVTVTSEVTISGNGDVFIEVNQTYIDNGELANEDWTGIATIQVWTMPAKNALKLATISSGVVTDERNMIPKVWELSTQIESIFSSLADLDERVEALEEADAIDHLEESWLVGELYTLTNKLFKQSTPILTNSTIDCNVWDTNDNYKVHIQRIGTWTPTNQLKLKVKSVGSPTTWLVVEVRKWVQVTVTANEEAYWYWWSQLVCSGSIAYSSISNSYAEFTVNMDWNFWWTKGELLDVVVYQTWNIVNSTNYYAIACDSTQYSEWFSYVSENNNSEYTRSKLMPYCIANGFAQSLLCKASNVVNNYSFTRSITNGTEAYAGTNSASYNETDKVPIITLQWEITTITANLRIKWNYNWYTNAYTMFSYNSSNVYWEDSNTSTSYVDKTYTITSTQINPTYSVYVKKNSSTATWVTRDWNYSITWSQNFRKTSSYISSPEQQVWIWETSKVNIFWIKDWDFYNWFSWILTSQNEKTTSATTWNITLWNAVGFIQMGEYKIPYYL